MATTDARYPGVSGVNPAWASAPELKEGELLSSWLARAAITNGCELRSLAGVIWPRWRALARDLDRDLTADRCVRLAEIAGLREEQARGATLRTWAERLHAGVLPERAGWSWITALGVRGPRRRVGPAFCPQCLAEDDEPYFRVQGRLAWHTVCLRHVTCLVDRCQECRMPVTVHRVAVGALSLARCILCGADLRKARTRIAPFAASAFQRRCDAVVRTGAGQCFSEYVRAPQWFAMASFFIGLRRRAERAPTSAYRIFFEALGEPLEDRPFQTLDLNLELLAVGERARLFTHVWPLLGATTDVIHDALVRAGLSRQAFAPTGSPVPEPIARLARRLPDRGRRRARNVRGIGPVTRRGVARRMARLARCAEASRW